MTCTWKDCAEAAVVPQVDADGAVWANLCPDHNKQLDDAIGGDIKLTLKYWILAQGGAAAAAKRAMERSREPPRRGGEDVSDSIFKGVPVVEWRELDGRLLRMRVTEADGVRIVVGYDDKAKVMHVLHIEKVDEFVEETLAKKGEPS